MLKELQVQIYHKFEFSLCVEIIITCKYDIFVESLSQLERISRKFVSFPEVSKILCTSDFKSQGRNFSCLLLNRHRVRFNNNQLQLNTSWYTEGGKLQRPRLIDRSLLTCQSTQHRICLDAVRQSRIGPVESSRRGFQDTRQTEKTKMINKSTCKCLSFEFELQNLKKKIVVQKLNKENRVIIYSSPRREEEGGGKEKGGG